MPTKRKAIAAALFMCVSSPSQAQNLLHALDGNWRHADGKRLSVKGPDVVTPGGKPLRADYARTFASWVIPEGEPNAGMTITMMLLGADRAHTREGAADTPPLEWRRCPAERGLTSLQRTPSRSIHSRNKRTLRLLARHITSNTSPATGTAPITPSSATLASMRVITCLGAPSCQASCTR